MKTKISLVVLIMILMSCKNNQLTNSYIYFDEPQPKDVEQITNFPDKYLGSFSRDYSHQIKVESNYVIQIEIESFHSTKKKKSIRYPMLSSRIILFTTKKRKKPLKRLSKMIQFNGKQNVLILFFLSLQTRLQKYINRA